MSTREELVMARDTAMGAWMNICIADESAWTADEFDAWNDAHDYWKAAWAALKVYDEEKNT